METFEGGNQFTEWTWGKPSTKIGQWVNNAVIGKILWGVVLAVIIMAIVSAVVVPVVTSLTQHPMTSMRFYGSASDQVGVGNTEPFDPTALVPFTAPSGKVYLIDPKAPDGAPGSLQYQILNGGDANCSGGPLDDSEEDAVDEYNFMMNYAYSNPGTYEAMATTKDKQHKRKLYARK